MLQHYCHFSEIDESYAKFSIGINKQNIYGTHYKCKSIWFTLIFKNGQYKF